MRAGAQVIYAQIDGSQLAKAHQPLHHRLAHMLGTRCGHDRNTTQRIQAGTDHAAVDAFEPEVANQLMPHLQRCQQRIILDTHELEPEQLVEHDALFKDFAQAGDVGLIQPLHRYVGGAGGMGR